MIIPSSPEKHVLGLSGGRDSAALAVYMRQHHPELEMEYFFTDTGKELPEVYEFLGRLEGFLGQEIHKLNPDRDFDFWLKQYNDFLPSPQTRWCTRQLKLRPFERWLRPMLEDGMTVYSYVAIRSDEEYRAGYASKHDNLVIKLPFKDAGIDKPGVLEILDGAGLGLPKYYEWRTRSGCTFCFFQQKIEWVRLREQHPEAFEEAKAYVVNMKLAERLTEAVNAAIKEMPAKPYAFLVRCRRILSQFSRRRPELAERPRVR